MTGNPPLQEMRSPAPVLPREGESLLPKALKPDYKIDRATGCWIWLKDKDKRGYGRSMSFIKPYGSQWAHRAYYVAAHGPIPAYPESVIDHLCRNPSCINPKHLEAVIPQTNIHRGSGAKLTMEIARDVRRRVEAGESAGQIKRELDVSIQNVWWIAEDRAWREDPSAPRQPVWPVKDCGWCGARIGPERGRKAKYCSDAHRTKAKNNRRISTHIERQT